jgi:hypothetical protein
MVRQIATDDVRLTYLARPLIGEKQSFVVAYMPTCFSGPLKVEFDRVDHIIHKPGDKCEDFVSNKI